jgi:ACS family 4-hydroxyphenylacetate permease-like MFS transporter
MSDNNAMGMALPQANTAHEASAIIEDERLIRKVSHRLTWFLCILFFCSFLDRINIGFAALMMNRDLGLSATTYGLANTIFYAGYVLCEIPSNLILARVGARIWLARIMITWGLASAMTMFAVGPNSLYLTRLLVGIAEAGFLPGVLLYMSYWFPPLYRARATSMFMVAMPVTGVIGSLLSGWLLDMHGVAGLSGWQWLFLIEGVPAIVLGVITFFYLDDRPENAKWLTMPEKVRLRSLLRDEAEAAQDAAAVAQQTTVLKQLCAPRVLLLALSYFCMVNSLNAISTWIPLIVRAVVQDTGSFAMTGVLTAIPSLAAVVAMIWWGARSDHRRERRFHVVAPMILTAVCWLLIAYAEPPYLRLLGAVGVVSGAYVAMSMFWTIPAGVLAPAARAAGIALIAVAGNIGSASSPTVIGWLRDTTHNFNAGLIFVSVLMLIGATILCLLPALADRPREFVPTQS